MSSADMYDVMVNGTKEAGCGTQTENGWAETSIYIYDGDVYVISRLGENVINFQKLS